MCHEAARLLRGSVGLEAEQTEDGAGRGWGQSLDRISSYDGTPTPYGQTFKTRFGS